MSRYCEQKPLYNESGNLIVRRCKKCLQLKPINEFILRSKEPLRWRWECRLCCNRLREDRLRGKGLTPSQYNRLLRENSPETMRKWKERNRKASYLFNQSLKNDPDKKRIVREKQRHYSAMYRARCIAADREAYLARYRQHQRNYLERHPIRAYEHLMRWRLWNTDRSDCISLDAPLAGSPDITFGQRIPDRRFPDLAVKLVRDERLTLLNNWIEYTLGEWQQVILYAYTSNDFDVAATAIEVDTSEEEVRDVLASIQEIGHFQSVNGLLPWED